MSMQIKPGPNATGFIMVPAAQGGGFPVQITALTNIATSGAVATVIQLDASGLLTNAQYGNVYIVPYPQFAEVGDKGFMTTYTPTSGLGGSDIRYVHISKQAFLVY